MAVHFVYMVKGRKMMRPITSHEEYVAIRDSERNRKAEKKDMAQFCYSCLPNDDGSLAGSKRVANTIGMDIDFNPEDSEYEQKMADAPKQIMSKKDVIGLQMFEGSATKGYHIVARRRQDLSQEDNLRWLSEQLGVEYDKGAKDITRVFFTPADKLLYLDDEIFEIKEAPPILPQGEGLSNASAAAGKQAEKTQADKAIKDTPPRGEMVGAPLPVNLRKFDLLLEKSELDADKMDVWGEHNWHTNLMSLLSMGLPKLMSREQLMAVVAERLPNYSQTEDCQKLINYFYDNYTADMGFMSVTLREVNAQAQITSPPALPDREGADGDDDALDKLREGWNPPEPPANNKLPRMIWLLIKPFPKQYHPILIITALVVLGTIASHYRSRYIDGRLIAANLFAAIIMGSGKGKSWISKMCDIICKNTLQTWDNAEWRKLRENQEMRDKMTNAKDKPAKYHPRFRIMETMSKTSLLEVQTNLGENGMLFLKYTESDELANSTRVSFSNLSVLLRKSWDMDIHRQFYMSEASCNTQCSLNAAMVVTGTPKSILGRLFADTENGMMQRFIPMMMPKMKRTFRPPVFSPLTSDEQAELDGLLLQLWQKDLSLGDSTLELEMSKTTKVIEEWYDELEERYNDGLVTEAEADLSHRVGQFMQRAAIPFVALYGEETKDMLNLIKWLGDYAYYNICYIFGKKVQQDLDESQEMLVQHVDARKTAEPLLSRMPETFTLQQFREERIKQGQSANVRMLLSRYCKNDKIRRISKGVYTKLM